MSNHYFSDTDKNNYVKRYIEKQLTPYGEMNYVYAVMNKKNTDEMIIISDLPEILVTDYLDKKKQNIDPVMINALNRITSFSWDENLEINSRWTVKKVFDPIKPYNINSGHAFVLHDHCNNIAVLSLYIDKYLRNEVEAIIRSCTGELQNLLIQAHDILLQIYNKERVPSLDITLSDRESEILYWCTTGKTYPEVADILQLTVSTIKFHMSRIVKKLGVKNAKHAISLSVEKNYLS